MVGDLHSRGPLSLSECVYNYIGYRGMDYWNKKTLVDGHPWWKAYEIPIFFAYRISDNISQSNPISLIQNTSLYGPKYWNVLEMCWKNPIHFSTVSGECLYCNRGQHFFISEFLRVISTCLGRSRDAVPGSDSRRLGAAGKGATEGPREPRAAGCEKSVAA